MKGCYDLKINVTNSLKKKKKSFLLLGLCSLICSRGCLWFPEMYSASQHLNILELYKDCSTESMTQMAW